MASTRRIFCRPTVRCRRNDAQVLHACPVASGAAMQTTARWTAHRAATRPATACRHLRHALRRPV
eukprot:3061808-Prymnesium_polylepis.2